MILNENKKEFLVALNKMFPNAETLSKKQLISVNKKLVLKSAINVLLEMTIWAQTILCSKFLLKLLQSTIQF